MAEEKTGQPEETKEPTTLNEYLDTGFDRWEKEIQEPEPKKQEAKPKEEKAADTKPCKECPEGETPETRTPYKILKVQGKEVPVYSEEELIELAQKGRDYTQKTQSLADDRKRAETEFRERADKLNELSKRYEELASRTLPKEQAQPKLTDAEQRAQIYKEYGLDEFDDDQTTKKLVDKIVDKERELGEVSKKVSKLEEGLNLVVLKEQVAQIKSATIKAREEFPFEEVIDDNGNNLTEKQYTTLLAEKIKSPANKSRQLSDLAVETVREIHTMQKVASPKSSELPANIGVEGFAQKYPDLYKQILEQGQKKGVTDYLEEKSEIPPGLKKQGAEVDTKKAAKTKEPQSLSEVLDEGFDKWERNLQEELQR